MYRENEFQRSIKWFLIGAAGLCSLCQIILLFYEFGFYSGTGNIFNFLYHLVIAICPGLMIFLYLKNIDDKEIYSHYLFALSIGVGSIIDICLVIKYILLLKNTDGFSVALIILSVVMILFGLFCSFCFIKYGLDKITCVVPVLLSFFFYIFRGCIYSTIDSRIGLYAYNSVDKSVFSIWTFMYIFFAISLIICVVLYHDLQFLQDLIRNPQSLFSKNTLFGTYSNLYLNDVPSKEKFNKSYVLPGNNGGNGNVSSGELLGICPDCGNKVFVGQSFCFGCGCPATYVLEFNSKVDRYSNDNSFDIQTTFGNENYEKDFHGYKEKTVMICPECGNSVTENNDICSSCGYPLK